MDFYTKFLNLCVANGVKPAEVGNAIGVSKAAVSHWKNGKYKPTDDKLIKLANFFNVSIDDLKDDEKPTTFTDSELVDMLQKFSSPITQQEVVDWVRNVATKEELRTLAGELARKISEGK